MCRKSLIVRDERVTADDVEEWLDEHRWDKEFFKRRVGKDGRNVELWLEKVHGAKVLSAIFSELSENRVTFDKVEHSTKLTKWIVANAPSELKEVSELLVATIEKGTPTMKVQK